MRIALFTECYRPIVNGVVVSVETFAGELVKLGHEVDVYAPAYPGHKDAEANVHRLPSISPPTRPRYPIALPYSGRFLSGAFAAHPPDIVHAQHPFATGREGRRLARGMKRPLVFTYHTLIRDYAHYVPLPRPMVRAAAVWVSRTFSNSADCVVAPTRGVEEVLRGYGVHRPIEVIPTGIDLDLIRGTEREPARSEFGIPEGAPLIAYSGRIAREKSLDVLVRAFALAAEREREAHLLLVGGGPWYERCRGLADSLGVGGRVHFTGYVERRRVFDCLAEAEVFAFASLTDTQGVAVLEAMALGCPAVAVRSGAVEDVIRDGVDGLIVEPSAEALAEGLVAVLGSDDVRRRLGGQARKRAEEFSAGRMAGRLAGVYKKLLEN
ncbi:MAG: glycosyltransferase family 4 protein [Armatimonadota bacterium]|nr:MAG: glycosyltransferase family 4 protein [Armatimonadota bacterium]